MKIVSIKYISSFLKRRYIVLFFALGLCVTSRSQNDSIYLERLAHFPLKGTYENKRDFIKHVYDSLRANASHQQTYYFLKAAIDFLHKKDEILAEVITINSMGLFYNNVGKYQNAINSFIKGIDLLKQNNSRKGYSNETQTLLYLLNLNYGNTFYFLGDAKKALVLYKKALQEIEEKKKPSREDSLKIAQVYNNFGIAYSVQKDYKTGTSYFKKALRINEKLRDSSKIANVLSNLASLHATMEQADSALKEYFVVKDIYEKGNDLSDLSFINSEIAAVYLNLDKPKIALPFAIASLKYCDTNAYSQELVSAYKVLSNNYEQLKDYRNEIKYLKLFNSIADSVKKEATLNEVNKNEALAEFNRIHLTDSLKTIADLKIKDLNIQSERNQSYFLVILLFIALVAVGLIYSRFKLTKKQKNVVDEKNREITDSINYAKRLQSAILPSEKEIESYFENSFVLFKPKDIVSGDFYFLEKQDEHIFIAAADCTGHGVPGAMLSVACHNALQRAVFEFKLIMPGEILDSVKKLIVENFSKSENEIRDGMDISLLVYNTKTKKVYWAGANNKLVYFENGELKEMKADRHSLGRSESQNSFTTNTLDCTIGSIFYLFTDGIVDQFGGLKNKKYTINRLRVLLESIKSKSLREQKIIMISEIEAWKKGNAQTDDITVLGIEI